MYGSKKKPPMPKVNTQSSSQPRKDSLRMKKFHFSPSIISLLSSIARVADI